MAPARDSMILAVWDWIVPESFLCINSSTYFPPIYLKLRNATGIIKLLAALKYEGALNQEKEKEGPSP